MVKFTIESLSFPEELEKALDKNTALMMRRGTTDVEMRLAQADALREAAKNPGMAGSMIGAGMGMGMGANMGRMFSEMTEPNVMTNNNSGKKFCPQCGAAVKSGAKFCPDCGAKFSSNNACTNCGATIKSGAKFCSECGNKL